MVMKEEKKRIKSAVFNSDTLIHTAFSLSTPNILLPAICLLVII